MGIDYFTKWVKVEPLAIIMEKNVRSFVWKSILCRFGIPRVLISDNGKQFNNDTFKNFCQRASWSHKPISAQDDQDSAWMGQNAYGQMSYSAPYGHIGRRVAHLLARHPSASHMDTKPSSQQKLDWPAIECPTTMKKRIRKGCLQLDLLDEVRATLEQMMARYQDLMAKHYNTKVKPRHF